MFIQAEDAIINLNHVVEFIRCEDTQQTYLRFNFQGSVLGFTKPSEMEYQLAVMINGSKHLVLSVAIHDAVMKG